MQKTDFSFISKAKKLAEKSLSDCITEHGILAGCHRCTDLWARDSFFASFGANAINQQNATVATIKTFLSYKRADGFIPYRIQRSPTTLGKYLGKPDYFTKPRANFRSRQSGGLVLDGGLMLIIAFAQYIRIHKNINFTNKYYQQLSDCVGWYKNKFQNGLLNEWFLCEWQDSVLKLGKTLYSNVLYWKALTDFAYISGLTGNAHSGHFLQSAMQIKEKINNAFWNGNYFSDWIDYKRHDIFNTYGNLLSVWWGLADKNQSQKILDFSGKNCLLPKDSLQDFTLEENYPKFPFWRIPLWNHLLGLADYHNRGCLWLQPGIMYALCLYKSGLENEALTILDKISRKIVEQNGVHEIYEKDGKPVKRLFYRSEFPFAWSSGLFLYAAYNIIKE